jgi:DnaK suppressor protein
MPGLNPEQLILMRERLCTLQADLMRRLDDNKAAVAPVELDQTTVGRLSRVDAMQQQAMAQASEHLAARQLARVRSALLRVDHGTYGVCTECGEPQGIRRLLADPCAMLCQECQEEMNAAAEIAARRRLVRGREA